MILDKYVKMNWHPTNKKYYIDKGYVFSNMGDEFLVKIIDLKLGSHTIIHVKCDICDNKKYLNYRTYNKNIKSGGYYGCSDKCSIDKYNNTNLLRYGVNKPSKTKQIQEKIKTTNLKKYGIKCSLQSEIVKDKIKATTIKKFGVEHNSQSEEIKEKKKETIFKNFGVKCYLTTEEFKDKTKQTNLERYGVENPAQSNFVKEKIKITNLERYGVESVLGNEGVRAKINKTILDRYGVENITMNKKYSEKATNTMIERYGEIWLKHCPTYNANSIIYLDVLSEKLNLPIQHALNGGEKKFVRYWVDGYIEKYNICLEWDERQHKYKKESDVKREIFLKENFNCQIIRINQKEFLKDVDNQINLVCNKINNLIKDNYNGKPI